MRVELLKKIAVAFEVAGGISLSDASKKAVVGALEQYPEAEVSKALDRCMVECKGRLSLADIVSRIDDGRPSPNEAWGMLPKSEYESAMLTDEMSSAYGVCCGMMDDAVGARMAFLEAYRREVDKSRAEHIPVKWTFSAGFDKSHREAVLKQAVSKGQLTAGHADKIIPKLESPKDVPLLEGKSAGVTEEQLKELTASLPWKM